MSVRSIIVMMAHSGLVCSATRRGTVIVTGHVGPTFGQAVTYANASIELRQCGPDVMVRPVRADLMHPVDV